MSSYTNSLRSCGLAAAVMIVLVLFVVAGCQTPGAAPDTDEAADAVQQATKGSGAADETPEATGREAVSQPDRDATGVIDDGTAAAIEIEPIDIALAGDITDPDAEISSMAWFGDTLILMPQYPGWAQAEGKGTGVVYAIDRDEIDRYLDQADPEPITPREIAFDADGLDETIEGFEGFEALAFDGNRAFLAVEAETDGDGNEPGQMYGFLVAGEMAADGSSLAVDSSVLTSVNLPVNMANMSIESLIVGADQLYALFEANGANVNEASDAAAFNLDLTPGDWVDFPTIEYRVTDATGLDADGTFWVTNYYWPGEADLLQPAADEIAELYGKGPTHALNEGVERLLPMRFGADGLELMDAPPVQLVLLGDEGLRNWEGIVRLGDRGWLLATDSFPTTMLAFVPMPTDS